MFAMCCEPPFLLPPPPLPPKKSPSPPIRILPFLVVDGVSLPPWDSPVSPYPPPLPLYSLLLFCTYRAWDKRIRQLKIKKAALAGCCSSFFSEGI